VARSPQGFNVGIDRPEPLVKHLPLGDGTGIIELLTHLTSHEAKRLEAMSPLGVFNRSGRGDHRGHRRFNYWWVAKILNLILNCLTFPSSGHAI